MRRIEREAVAIEADRIEMSLCRVLLRQSAQLHDPSPHVAVDATYYERSPASKHYCDRTNYCVQTIDRD